MNTRIYFLLALMGSLAISALCAEVKSTSSSVENQKKQQIAAPAPVARVHDESENIDSDSEMFLMGQPRPAPSTISGIMVKPALTSSSSTNNNQLSSKLELDELEDSDDDIEDQVQAIPQPSSNSATMVPAAATSDLKTAAGYHYPSHHGGHGGGHHYGKYYQYASVPYPYAWEFGYRRGNPYHTIERHEKGKGSHFHTKVKWSDKHAGYGVHVWDYNHDDHHKHHYGGGHHGGHGGHHGYGHH